MNLMKGVQVEGRRWIKLIHVSKILKDPSYQRDKVQSNLKQIGGEEFDILALRSLVVARRKNGGCYYVLDGQHRLEVIKAKLASGELTNPFVLCEVVMNTTIQEEAKLYGKYNTNRPVTGNEKIRADLHDKDSSASHIEQIVESQGYCLLFLSRGKPSEHMTSPNGMRSPKLLQDAYKKFKAEKFTMALEVIKKCFNGEWDAQSGEFVYCLCKFLSTQSVNKWSLNHIIAQLKGKTASSGRAYANVKSMGSGHKRKDRLSEWFALSCGLRIAA